MEDRTNTPDLVDGVRRRFAAERPDIPPDLVEAVCRVIVAGRRMQARGARIVQAMGGHYTDYDVLGTLRTVGPPYELTPAALIKETMLTSGAMTACLGRLERAALITRHIDTTDRRVRRIRLTQKGLALADEALSKRFGDAAEIFAGFGREDMARLNALLRDVAARAEGA